jgi:hypothetical protein
MRVYRVGPTLAAISVFLLLANILLVVSSGGAAPEAGDPKEEAWLIFYAIRYLKQPPENIDQEELRRILKELDPDAERIADRFEVLSYSLNGRQFELRLQHVDGARYRLDLGGVKHG